VRSVKKKGNLLAVAGTGRRVTRKVGKRHSCTVKGEKINHIDRLVAGKGGKQIWKILWPGGNQTQQLGLLCNRRGKKRGKNSLISGWETMEKGNKRANFRI